MNSRRKTVMIDEDLNRKLLGVLANRIKKEQKSISYSRVLNDALRKSL